MQLHRFVQHTWASHWQLHRAFPAPSLAAIESAVGNHETLHGGEIRFAVEAGLGPVAVWQGQSARDRALQVFSQLRVWDTEHNNGILIYVLLADRAVEIVADRGIHAVAGSATWQAICTQMERAFSKAEFRAGALEGIDAVSKVLETRYPQKSRHGNELSDAPMLL